MREAKNERWRVVGIFSAAILVGVLTGYGVAGCDGRGDLSEKISSGIEKIKKKGD